MFELVGSPLAKFVAAHRKSGFSAGQFAPGGSFRWVNWRAAWRRRRTGADLEGLIDRRDAGFKKNAPDRAGVVGQDAEF
jgi:hypothetical protein